MITVTWVVHRALTLGQHGPRDSRESSPVDFSSPQKGHDLPPFIVKESGAGRTLEWAVGRCSLYGSHEGNTALQSDP